jgi:hypothetical protein
MHPLDVVGHIDEKNVVDRFKEDMDFCTLPVDTTVGSWWDENR